MRLQTMRALCLGVAGIMVFSTAAAQNADDMAQTDAPAAALTEQETDSRTGNVLQGADALTSGFASVTAGALTSGTATAGFASVTVDALASETAAVSETENDLTAAAQEAASVYGYTNLGIAVVSDGNLNVREAPGTDASLVGKMPNHSACEILSEADGWTQIESGEVSGYVKSEYLVTGNEAAALAEEIKETVATVTTTTLYVREEPNTDCDIVTAVPLGEELEVLEELDGWVKINIDSDEGYVSADYVEIATGLPTAMTMTEVRYGQGVSDVRVALVQYACQFVGNPYVWGGTSLTKGADCSGFVLSVFKNYGVTLPHSSAAQSKYGTSISASEAQPGDLFFYGKGKKISHVAIYIGNGQIVHARSSRTGIVISNAYYRTPLKVVSILD